ncbi:hypothetical protein IFM89_025576 [Coptis chinensis]|uniref:F-box domain-containing protein n=1 Tax=Coptis chinensis TaxID=261450 RepID=A0A835IMF7_9MAGN|nr:hypothetical protein IFM89_025576 [Coptis chinensis]
MAATDASIVVKKKQRLRGGLGRHNYFKSLPEEISLEILHRLTAEDLSSCKCVSKLCSSFISRPTFGNAHLLRSIQEQGIIFTTVTKPANRIHNYQYNHFSISLTPPIPPSLNPRKELKMPFLKLKKWGTEEQVVDENDKEAVLCLKASCDGLLLFQNKYNPRFLYISNPITSHFQALPPCGSCTDWALFPDHHSASVGKYKVFGILDRTLFRTLTVRTGDCGKKTTPRWMLWGKDCDDFFKVSSQIVLVQNHLCWLTHERDTDNSTLFLSRKDCCCLYMFDIKTRKRPARKQVPRHLLQPRRRPRTLNNLLSVLNDGSLCLTIVSPHQLQMFVLHDTLTNIWTRSHCISLQSLRNHPPLTSFLSDNTCLVAMRGVDSTNLSNLVKVVIHLDDELMLFDLGTHELRQIGCLSKDRKLIRPYYFHSNTLVTLC